MGALPAADSHHSTSGSSESDGSTSETLETRQSEEIVIAFMGAVGCGMPGVISKCETLLDALGYKVEKIKLSDFLGKQISAGNVPSLDGDDRSRYLKYQTAGNSLRKQFGNEILAEYAINAINRNRLSHDISTKDLIRPVPRVAYLVDQIKHPDEATLLRLVYRKLFYLIGVMSTMHNRTARLQDEGICEDVIKAIIKRDRKESEKYGQQLEKAFKHADYFIENPFGKTDYVEGQLTRFFHLIHGHNGITPNKHEYAMYVAYSTGLKSGCLSRQVGAAITDPKGNLLSVGSNDVPQYGGGLYSPESAEDNRCFKRGVKSCENAAQKTARRIRLLAGLTKDLPALFEDEKIREAVKSKVDDIATIAFSASGMPDLIEFSRAVHAEMEAIVSLARGSLGSTVGATLYTTTFPCHNCARHIIAAGIRRVYYIEPYEKSLALESHGDAIVVLDHDDNLPEKQDQKRVEFVHFSGVAPNLFPSLFMRERGRKGDDGSLICFDLSEEGEPPRKIVREYLDSYRAFETKVAGIFDENFPMASPSKPTVASVG